MLPPAWVARWHLSFWSVDVIDSRKQLLSGLLVDVRAETDVHQVGQLLHGIFLFKHNKESKKENTFAAGKGIKKLKKTDPAVS